MTTAPPAAPVLRATLRPARLVGRLVFLSFFKKGYVLVAATANEMFSWGWWILLFEKQELTVDRFVDLPCLDVFEGGIMD